MPKQICFIVIIIIFSFGCDSPKKKISKYLERKYTGFDIVEIRKDSANIDYAVNVLSSLQIQVLDAGTFFIENLKKIKNEPNDKIAFHYYLSIDSVYKTMIGKIKEFEVCQDKKKTECYYVRYLVHKNEIKIPKEEYLLIREHDGDIKARNYYWIAFLADNGFYELEGELNKYYYDVLLYKKRFKKYL
jgi:hypothetical protein